MATYSNGTKTASYKYDENGVRTSKTVNGTKTSFFVDGTTILAQKAGNITIPFYYDGNGKRIAFKYGGSMYFYVYNLQGDVTHILDDDANIVGTYTYDAWGKITNLNSLTSIAQTNPFRYRGYYYDTESGLYYLNSRYYNPEWGRFISADNVALLGANGDFTSYNIFAYCGNNPVVRRDTCGTAWETVFDAITLALSIYDVFQNPKDVLAWVGLAGDALDLIPFVTGLGEAARAAKITDSIVDSSKVASKIDDVVDADKSTKKVAGTITGYTKHGLNQAIGRNNGLGVSPSAILDAVRNPMKIVEKTDDFGRHSVQYKGIGSTVVINDEGKIVSCWARSSKFWRGN